MGYNDRKNTFVVAYIFFSLFLFLFFFFFSFFLIRSHSNSCGYIGNGYRKGILSFNDALYCVSSLAPPVHKYIATENI